MSFRRSPSFTLAAARLKPVAGVRPWLHGVQLTSTGVHPLDQIIGGGIPVHGLVLLLEDEPTSYYRTLLQQGIAEGVARRHKVVVCSAEMNEVEPRRLPFVVNWTPAENAVEAEGKRQGPRKCETSGNLMEESRRLMENPATGHLANMAAVPSRPRSSGTKPPGTRSRSSTSLCHSFDLSRSLQPELAAANPPVYIDPQQIGNGNAEKLFASLLEKITSELDQAQCISSPSNLARICLHSLASPFWGTGTDITRSLMRFVIALRSLVRRSSAVAIVTISPGSFPSSLISRLRSLFDIMVSVHSFAGRPSSYGDYDALLKLERLPRMHSWNSVRPETMQYLLKMKRRGLVLDKLALPPEHSREGDGSSHGCSGDANLPGGLSF